jgi:hypothetical protein
VQSVTSIKDFFKILFKKPGPRIIELEITDDGFITRRDDGYTEQVYWQEIKAIYTYKNDCFGYDSIWLAFEREEKEEVHVPEDAKTFGDFRTAVNQAFPNLNAEWYFDVMQPPFAENLTVLFEREKSSAR